MASQSNHGIGGCLFSGGQLFYLLFRGCLSQLAESCVIQQNESHEKARRLWRFAKWIFWIRESPALAITLFN